MLPYSHRSDQGGQEALPEQSCNQDEELHLLRILRASREHHSEHQEDVFSVLTDRELARLRFLHWRVVSGRISP
jgi:hypothetical protein